MSMKITEIEGQNGQKIYIQYDEDENDDLQAVGYVDDIAERTRKYQEVLKSTIQGYSQQILDSLQFVLLAPKARIYEQAVNLMLSDWRNYFNSETLGRLRIIIRVR
ncbi:MAG: hypothetical protein AAFO04_07085 [Cyanobacteria bacterium J06592_8]